MTRRRFLRCRDRIAIDIAKVKAQRLVVVFVCGQGRGDRNARLIIHAGDRHSDGFIHRIAAAIGQGNGETVITVVIGGWRVDDVRAVNRDLTMTWCGFLGCRDRIAVDIAVAEAERLVIVFIGGEGRRHRDGRLIVHTGDRDIDGFIHRVAAAIGQGNGEAVVTVVVGGWRVDDVRAVNDYRTMLGADFSVAVTVSPSTSL